MTQVLLSAGPGLLVVRKDGLLYFRRPDQPDTPVPYLPANYPVFMSSARGKYDLSPVLGPGGEEAPVLPEGTAMPQLRLEHLSNGAVIYRLVEGRPGGPSGTEGDDNGSVGRPSRPSVVTSD
jgi:hypothetical protein